MRLPLPATFVSAVLWAFAAGGLAAQTSVQIGGLQQDSTLPVEVESDVLTVDQQTGVAVFTGNVKVVQGDMTITAQEARVEYTPEGNAIEKVFFFGDVLFVSPTDAAQAEEAVYTLPSGEVVMSGSVLLTQGRTTIAGNRLTYDLDAGTGVMEGRVQTTFVPGKANP